MKSKLTLLVFAVLMMGASLGFAQQRYIDSVFANVDKTADVQYGTNIGVITGAPAAQPLIMDVYTPNGDTATNRPVVLFAHSGNFLPQVLNGAYNGTRTDSVVLEICLELAKRGYVAIAYDYRLGWDPLNTDPNIRKSTILQAAYRGIQDTRGLIRYLRYTAEDSTNPYGIDPSKIIVGGVGTGGYISMGAAYLHDYTTEIQLLVKFNNLDSVPPQPYIDTNLHGNIWGTNVTPLNMANYPTKSSAFNLSFNLGGALGDSSWINQGEMPTVGFHTPQDPNAPYAFGDVIVPTTGEVVIDEAAGSYLVAKINNRMGNNDVFKSLNLNDGYTQAANKNNDGYEGLFPFDRPLDSALIVPCGGGINLPASPEGSPWDWWDEAWFIAAWDALGAGTPGFIVNCSQRAGNPDMSPEKGRTHIDTVMGYACPRFAMALGLTFTSIEDDLLDQAVTVYPNPATYELRVITEDNSNPIRDITLVDITGRAVRTMMGLRTFDLTVPRNDLPSGLYFLRIRGEKGQVTRKVIFR